MRFSYPKVRTYTVKLDGFSSGVDKRVDESFIPDKAGDSFNFCLSDGALKDGFGIKSYSVESDNAEYVPNVEDKTIKKVYYYKKFDTTENSYDNRILVFASDGYLYETKAGRGTQFVKLEKSFSLAPWSVNYKLNGEDVIIFSDDSGLSVYDGEDFYDYQAPEITSMCLHAERLFVSVGGERTSLWFSDNFDPTNWYVSLDEAGFIDFQDGLGRVLKAVDFKGYVYVFRDQGITRVTGYFDQRDFSAESVAADKVQIFADTIADCGKKLIYLTSDGFYSFDGTYTNKIMSGIASIVTGVDNQGSVAAYHNGNYYCTVNVRVGEKTEKRVICYDVEDRTYYFAKGFSVGDMLSVTGDDGNFYFAVDGYNKLGVLDENCRLFGNSLLKVWKNNRGNFGTDEVKTLARMNICSNGNCLVKLKSENGERKIYVRAQKSVQRLPVGLKGQNFSITFESVEFGAKISSVSLEFAY